MTPGSSEDALGELRSRDDATAARLEGRVDAGDYRRREGFLAASRLLLEAAIGAAHWTDRDALIWPALFSFRHFLELRMKQLATLGAPLGLDQPAQVHRLRRLWPAVRDGIADQLGDPDEPISIVERALALFDALDPTGEGLRYAMRRDGSPSMRRDVYLDPAALLQLIAEVSDVLDAAEMAFDYAIDSVRLTDEW